MDMDLEKKLAQILPVDLYGRGKAKDWNHLMGEIRSGESAIQWDGDKPIRMIWIVVLDILAPNGRFLFEAYQQFADGRRRERGHRGVSEKLHPQEDVSSGAKRALMEELGFSEKDVSSIKIEVDALSPEVEIRESPSYPGLQTKYVKFAGKAYLPESLVREEYIEYTENSHTTVFHWSK